MRSVLELCGVWKSRGEGPRATDVLSGASLSVEPGEFVLLEGPSGSGKTTLLAVAAGLLVPSRGTVLLDSRPLEAGDRRTSAERRRRQVGFVFQRPSLLPGLTLEENVSLAGALAGLPPAETAGETTRLLSRLGLGHVAARRPGEVSGGEEQRAAVARALVHRPALVLADEPTGNLDRATGRAVAECLAALAGERGVGVLVATHDDRLAPFCTRRLRLVDGHVEPREEA
ncbi:MAG: ABC transporter ATP-binding protein [Holophagales bacterium]|nr:ABC transporter ATP-binding protein [Holophagales bacterium]